MPNRLAAATSPYLLQHAENPVAWHEWGGEAFALARQKNRPVFLSIGYSTCHWCHVMAHESFENPEVAAVLNEYFVSIKVDREERPDIDRLYMAFVQATTGSGGWPMSVWLTPNAEPFFGGTYFPPADCHGRPGFVTVLERIAELWAREPERVLAQGADVIASLRETSAAPAGAEPPDASPLRAGCEAFAGVYDPVDGGFGGGPKFPRPSVFNFLLRIEKPRALEMTLHTLRRMAAGGVRDHLGGGFHRYSVDGGWRVPHFEKMLYDQAQLAGSHLDAWQITNDPHFADIVRETLGYVSRRLTHPRGGFFSAEDADSLFEHGKPEHGEGAFYVWSHEEIARHLDAESAAIFCRHYGVEPGGNVDPSADPHHEFTGRNILFEREPAGSESLAKSRALLAEVRDQRPRPHLDDKILTAWNGLMISAFARAGAVLDDEGFLAAAGRAAAFIRSELFDEKSGELLRTWRDGRAAIRAFAEDYAFLIQGLLDLYEAGFDSAWLSWAIELQGMQDKLFFDQAAGSYLGSAEGDPLVPLRLRDDYDGAEPSANSIAARNLLRLGWLLHDDAFVGRARRVVGSFATILRRMPSAVPQMLCALDMLLAPPRQCVIAGGRGAADTAALARALHRKFEPNRVILFAGDTAASREMKPIGGRAALYVCEDFACRAPITDPSEIVPRLRASA
ncbi:MAG: thioredoxin domain-containing protein [Terrimicrobiaceae bacterium]|nr:thioredoxin domain-containing protein [Terrimicrobiaceae bacterium]